MIINSGKQVSRKHLKAVESPTLYRDMCYIFIRMWSSVEVKRFNGEQDGFKVPRREEATLSGAE